MLSASVHKVVRLRHGNSEHISCRFSCRRRVLHEGSADAKVRIRSLHRETDCFHA